MRHRRRPYREHDGNDEDVLSDNLTAVNDRLDDLTRQIERMTQGAEIRPNGNEGNGDRVADALVRLDRRLQQVLEDGGAPPQAYTPPPQA